MKRIALLLMVLAVPALAQDSWQGTAVRKVLDKNLAVTGRDSTGIIDVRNASNLGLMIKVNPAGGGTATPFATLAISCRGHLDDLADSNNVFVWSPNVGLGLAGTADSLNYGVYGAIAGQAPHRSEIVVVVSQSATGRRGVFVPLAGVLNGTSAHPPFISFHVRQIVGSGTARVQMWLTGYQP